MSVSHTPRHRSTRVRVRRRSRATARLTALLRWVRQTNLLIRFGVLSAGLVAALGLVLGVALEDTVRSRALWQAEQSAATVARLAVEPRLHPEDFQSGRIAADRLADLENTLRDVGTAGQPLRVKVFDTNGTVLYSDEAEVIGDRSTSDDLRVALAGGIASAIESEAHEASEKGLGALLEVYVPVSMATPGGERIVGAFEMYLPYGPIAANVAADARLLHLLLAVGLVVLWAGLFRLMATASRRLREHAQQNRWLARHDSLTGLPNRVLFVDRTEKAVAAAQRSGDGTAVILVDVDRFKEVNDTLGHRTGDALLRAVGERLHEQLGDTDTVARLGGDEFALLLPAVPGKDAAVQVAETVLAALRTPFVVDELTLEIDASIGVATFPEQGAHAGQLLQRADMALYQAKQNHEGVLAYRPELDVHTPARLALFGELRRAVDDGQLLLHYQPKVDLADGHVTGVEALVRWHHPQRGLLLPGEFIPVAEQTGLIRPMTLRVLELALRDCRTWRDAGLELSVAVNLSARSLLDSGLPMDVHQLLGCFDLPAEVLELEITETTAMVDPGRALSVLASLRALGVRLSVDDYGTGHASLSYLHQLPVDTLKIDRSFVQTMDRDEQQATIVRSTIDLARNLGLQVVAEGVESEAAWRQLGALGCDAAQGYWLARPGSATEIPHTVAELRDRLAGAVSRHPAA